MIGGCAIATPLQNQFIIPIEAKKGDLLLLTKPLGMQVAVNSYQWLKANMKQMNHIKNLITEE